MKTASAALIALLNSQTFQMADLLTFTLKDSTVLRYTSWDTDLIVGGLTFSASGVQFKRGTVRTVVGIEVDSMELTLYALPENMAGDYPIFESLRKGLFDGSRVKVEKTFMATAGDTTAGSISVFSGRVSGCTLGRSEASLTVVSDLILLNVQMPRNVYQPSCLHTLFDDDMLALGHTATGCGLLKSAFEEHEIAVTGSTVSQLSSLSSHVDGYYNLGYIVFTGGLNTGVKRTVKSFISGQFTLVQPLPYVPDLGDPFNAYPGCDHLQSTCQTKFNNILNFRGMPYVPVPETGI